MGIVEQQLPTATETRVRAASFHSSNLLVSRHPYFFSSPLSSSSIICVATVGGPLNTDERCRQEDGTTARQREDLRNEACWLHQDCRGHGDVEQ